MYNIYIYIYVCSRIPLGPVCGQSALTDGAPPDPYTVTVRANRSPLVRYMPQKHILLCCREFGMYVGGSEWTCIGD